MNTFEKHFEDFPEFLRTISSWSPDYIVPVAKKACKLLKTVPALEALRRNPDLIKYRNFFKLSNASVENKRIAVLDDATQYTSTLQEYRRYFENLGAKVRTFSFVGHEEVVQTRRWKEDASAEISKSLPEPVYQEYILQQSYHLLSSGNHFDLDHLTFEVQLPSGRYHAFLSALRRIGLLLFVEDYFLQTKTRRFSLDDVSFFNTVPYLKHDSVALGALRKIKFAYNETTETLAFSPLVFPTWSFQKCELGAALLRDVPFVLPYELPDYIDRTNEGALLRTYYDIYFACAVSLAKAFVQKLSATTLVEGKINIRRNDLDALLGVRSTDTLLSAVKSFIDEPQHYNFVAQTTTPRVKSGRLRYHEFGDVIDDLRKGYQKRLLKRKSRIGVHYYLPYDKLFQRFKDKAALSEGLDFYCDFGIVVPETVIDTAGGRILRACRAGEPSSDYNWRRTQVLIPMAIEQFRTELKKSNAIDATILNKLLSNFVFDYPSETYHELHSLIGEPYTFGTLVRAYHPHRASRKPTIYDAERISPFYRWDETSKTFSVTKRSGLVKEIRAVFDERQEIPYSEIVTYFRLLARVYAISHKVDILNMLSICREENYFYSHILYNIRMALEDFGLYFDVDGSQEKQKALRSARKLAKSANDKARFGKGIDETMKMVERRFGDKLEFVGAVTRLKRNYTRFSNDFRTLLSELEMISQLQRVLASLCFFRDAKDTEQIAILQSLGAEDLLRKAGIELPMGGRPLLDDIPRLDAVINSTYNVIRAQFDSLPREEPLLATRLKTDSLDRAKNIATNYVYRNNLRKIVLLYIDFTGLREIPEPKEVVISRYYDVVKGNTSRRSGERLYGGSGGDDAFTIAFRDVAPALHVQKISRVILVVSSFCGQRGGILSLDYPSQSLIPRKRKKA